MRPKTINKALLLPEGVWEFELSLTAVGGNMIPDLLGMISGKNIVGASVECALGNLDVDISFKEKQCFYATHNLHSKSNGIYKGINFSDEIKQYIVKKILYKNEGDRADFLIVRIKP